MKLSQLGEFGLIDRIARREPMRGETVVGIGDDCAVLQSQKSKVKSQKYLLITTDTFIENVHFKISSLQDFFYLGRKAIAANISDIAAMGGYPSHALVTIGLPKNTNVKAVDELYRGINSLARKYKIDIIGGDTIASPREIVVSITLLGGVEKKHLLLRSTARAGDLICVSGRFGGPAAEKFKIQKSKVKIRLKEAREIAKAKIATSMIDSSDGLVRSVLELCRASKVGALIFEDKVPIAKGATLDQALYGGEEYELVLTISKSKYNKLKTRSYVVGEIVPRKQDVRLVDSCGRIKSLKSGGYEHYK